MRLLMTSGDARRQVRFMRPVRENVDSYKIQNFYYKHHRLSKDDFALLFKYTKYNQREIK